MADDGAIGLECEEERQGQRERKSQPCQAEFRSQSVIRKQEAHEDKGADRRRQRDQQIDRKDQLRIEEPVQTKLRNKLFNYFHNSKFQIRLEGTNKGHREAVFSASRGVLPCLP